MGNPRQGSSLVCDYYAVTEYYDIYDRHTFSDPTPFTTLAMVDLAIPLPPVVSDLAPTSVVVTGTHDPNFDAVNSGSCLRLFDATTSEEILINGSSTAGCGSLGTTPDGLAKAWPQLSLQPENDYYAVTEYYDIYDRHTFSDPTAFTTPPIPPWEF